MWLLLCGDYSVCDVGMVRGLMLDMGLGMIVIIYVMAWWEAAMGFA